MCICVQKKTKAKLGATAGLRMLPEGKADHILAAVKKFLQASPFQLDDQTGVSILDGMQMPFFLLQPGCASI